MSVNRGWICVILITLAMINYTETVAVPAEAQLVAASLLLIAAVGVLTAARRPALARQSPR
jgi:hypothetical protein